MESIELDSLPNSNHSFKNRWQEVDLGLVFTVWKILLKNVSDRVCGILTFISSMILSISDTISDVLVALTLFSSGQRTWGWIVIIVDYLPSWILACHNSVSKKWKSLGGVGEKITTVGILILSPFSMVVFHARWLYHFETASQEVFNLMNHNCRLSMVLSGSFESPVQIVILLVLWGQNQLELPWNAEACITDSRNRSIYVGAFPGMFSLIISCLSLLKGSMDIAEEETWQGKGMACIYAMVNYTFRLTSMALAILYLDEWSLILFAIILITNLILILRFDPTKRSSFSVVSSVMVASVTPFVASDQAHLFQQTKTSPECCMEENNNRRKLASKTSMAVTICCLVADFILLILLKYNENFLYNSAIDAIMGKDDTEKVISLFLLPLGGLAIVAIFLYSPKRAPEKTCDSSRLENISYLVKKTSVVFKTQLQKLGLVLVFLGFIALSGNIIQQVNHKECKFIE